jgi:pimeloyl-ACP methyl ester carboxylesterase
MMGRTDAGIGALRCGSNFLMLFKLVMGLLALAVVTYLGICAWMYYRQRSLLFFPQETRVEAKDTDFVVAHDGITLRGWAINPGNDDAILYFGGNAERIEQMREEFSRWVPATSVYLLSYRGYGANEGQPSEKALFEDALALYDEVKTRQHAKRISIVGRSLGSAVASYAASKRPVTKLVLVTPFDSGVNLGLAYYPWLPVPWLMKDRFKSTTYLRRYTGPTLVIRAGKDEVIPAANTDRLIAALPNPPQVVNILEGTHNTLNEFPAYGEALSSFLGSDSR